MTIRDIAIVILIVACAAMYVLAEKRGAQIVKKDAELEQYKSAYMTLAEGVRKCTAATNKMVAEEKMRLQKATESRKEAELKSEPIRKKRRALMALDAPRDDLDCKRADDLLSRALNDEN